MPTSFKRRRYHLYCQDKYTTCGMCGKRFVGSKETDVEVTTCKKCQTKVVPIATTQPPAAPRPSVIPNSEVRLNCNYGPFTVHISQPNGFMLVCGMGV